MTWRGFVGLPNFLTWLRIVLSVVFMILVFADGVAAKAAALFIFLTASLTDYWDGRIARAKNQVSGFGKLMDPIADKVLTLSAFLAFVQMGIIPAWMVVMILLRDFLITGLRLLMTQGSRGESSTRPYGTRSSGKHKTVLQFSAIIGVLLFLTAKETPFWRSEWTPDALQVIYVSMAFIVAVTLASGVRYAVKNKDVFRA